MRDFDNYIKTATDTICSTTQQLEIQLTPKVLNKLN